MNKRLNSLCVILVLVGVASAQKISPRVEKASAQRSPVPVIVLCRTQLLETPDGFPHFCEAHDRDPRSALRHSTIEQLKAIAGNGEQQAVLNAIQRPVEATSFWVVNAVAAFLTPAEIRKTALLPDVKYIYFAQRPGPASREKRKLSEIITPTDRPAFSTEDRVIPWNLKKIGADRVWSDLKITGENTVVALLDSGANYAHADLRNNIWINAGEIPNNDRDDDRNGFVDDYYGYDFTADSCEVRASGDKQHGTWTGGIIAGDGTGGILTGVAPRTRFMLLRASGIPAVMQAFQYALENGADIINMSFSVPDLDQERGLWRLLAEQTVAAGTVLVSGCGNFQQTQPIPVQIRIPEGIPCVIAAGGLDENLQVPRFCSLGPVEWQSVEFYRDYPLPTGLIKPDVCAFPGPRYPVLAAAERGYIDPNSRIKGNSFSSPHIAGVAALMLSAAPELPAWKVKTLLEKTAQDLEKKGKDTRTGAGLVRADDAVLAAQKEVGERPKK
ncbi:MAG: S8 family serine peptidase [Kiritimatiellales bacterium]